MKAAAAYALMQVRFLDDWIYGSAIAKFTYPRGRTKSWRFVLATDAATESGVARQLAAIARDQAFEVASEETALDLREVLAIQTTPRCIEIVVQRQVAGFATFHSQLRRQVYAEQRCPTCASAVALVDSTHPEERGVLLAECVTPACTWAATPTHITVYRRGAST